MKSRFLLLATALLATPLAFAATGPLKEKALALSNTYKNSVVHLSAVIELEVTAGDNPTQKEERKVELLGTVINKSGLIVVANSSLDVANSVDGRTVNTPKGPIKLSAKSNTKEVKVILPDGSEIPAKVSFKDADLDLAFIRPEKEAEGKLTPIDTSSTAKLGLLDDVIVLGRLGKDLNREPVVATTEVLALVTKPRPFARVGAQTLGLPVFNSEGKFVGLGVNRFSPKSDSDAPQGGGAQSVVLPAEDVLEAAAQAK